MIVENWCNNPIGVLTTTFIESHEKYLPRREYNADRASATSVSRAKDRIDGPANELNPEREANNIAKGNTEPPKAIESSKTRKKKNQPSKNAQNVHKDSSNSQDHP